MSAHDNDAPKTIHHEDGRVEMQFSDGSSSIMSPNGETTWSATDGSSGFNDGQGYSEKTTLDGHKFWSQEEGNIGIDNADGSSETWNPEVDVSDSWGEGSDQDDELGIMPMISSGNDEPPGADPLSVLPVTSNEAASPQSSEMDNMAQALDNAQSPISEEDLPDIDSENDLLIDDLNNDDPSNKDPDSIV